MKDDGKATWDAPVELTDGLGRKWELRVTVDDLESLRRLAQLDLSDVSAAIDRCGKLPLQPELLVRVLYHLCEEQAKAAGVTPSDFAKGFAGRILVASAFKLTDAVFAFFPFVDPQMGVGLRSELKSARSAALSKSAGKRRESSASTRGRSRSGS